MTGEVAHDGSDPLDFVEFVKAIVGARYQWVRQEDAIDMAVSAAYWYQKATGVRFEAAGQPVEVWHSLGKMRRLVRHLGALDDDLELTMPRPWTPLDLLGWPNTVAALRQYVRSAMVIAVQEVNRESLLAGERDQVAERVGDIVAAQLGITTTTASPQPASPAPSGADGEVIERAARAAHDAVRAPAPTNWVGSMWDEYWFPIARAVLAAAQPAPEVADTAEVLAGLVEEMRREARELSLHDERVRTTVIARWLTDLVEDAQRRLEGTEK